MVGWFSAMMGHLGAVWTKLTKRSRKVFLKPLSLVVRAQAAYTSTLLDTGGGTPGDQLHGGPLWTVFLNTFQPDRDPCAGWRCHSILGSLLG